MDQREKVARAIASAMNDHFDSLPATITAWREGVRDGSVALMTRRQDEYLAAADAAITASQ